MPRKITRLTARTAGGARRSSQSYMGVAIFEVSGATIAVIAVAIASTGATTGPTAALVALR